MRRTKRFGLSLAVRVRGRDTDNLPFAELTRTLSINAHGGLVLLAARVTEHQVISVENTDTGEVCDGKIVRILPWPSGQRAVGFEFVGAAKGFWGMHFPPHATD
jgi:secreted trypsin-like serine protease